MKKQIIKNHLHVVKIKKSKIEGSNTVKDKKNFIECVVYLKDHPSSSREDLFIVDGIISMKKHCDTYHKKSNIYEINNSIKKSYEDLKSSISWYDINELDPDYDFNMNFEKNQRIDTAASKIYNMHGHCIRTIRDNQDFSSARTAYIASRMYEVYNRNQKPIIIQSHHIKSDYDRYLANKTLKWIYDKIKSISMKNDEVSKKLYWSIWSKVAEDSVYSGSLNKIMCGASKRKNMIENIDDLKEFDINIDFNKEEFIKKGKVTLKPYDFIKMMKIIKSGKNVTRKRTGKKTGRKIA